VATIGEAIASGEFPQLASVLAEGGQAREPDFERLARWAITGLIEQAQRS
jgi:hypothetical protein